VVIAAKSDKPVPRTPGSIYDPANEIRALGQRAPLVPTDVRQRRSHRNMVDKTSPEFGRVDILVTTPARFGTPTCLEHPA